ncbi:hypothetical protein ACQKO5_19165 [Novosphingobium subterraneum]|uniref:hypothetical protein n=1 Tax=Novosphingobium subterraneum TaxID=48936 RepID=UPI003D07F3F1
MGIFSIAPINVPGGALPRINRNDIVTLSEAEFASDGRHWIFDSGDAECLNGVSGGRALTLGDVTPTYVSNYIGLTNGPSDGLRTDLSDTNINEITMWAVARQPAADGTNGNRFLIGNQTGSAGIGVMLSGSSSTLTVTARMAASGNPYAVGTVSVNNWFFIAVSFRLITGSLAVRAKLNGDTVDSYTPLAGVVRANLPFAVGNYHYATGPAAAQFQFAEFGVVEALFSNDDLDGLYQRAQARMALRGITI